MFRKIKIILGVVITLSIIFSSLLYADPKGKYERYKTRYHSTDYRDPAWLNNETIIFVKRVTYFKKEFLPIVSEFSPLRGGISICTMDLEGENEKAILTISWLYKRTAEGWKKGEWIELPDKEFDKGVGIGRVSVNPKDNNKICFRLAPGAMYIMDIKKTNFKKIAEDGRDPEYSPDGTKILYRRKDGLYIMNSDGGNKYKLVDGTAIGIWHPDGKRIFFSYGHGSKDYNIYMINIDGTGKEKFIEESSHLGDWSPDGSRFIAGRGMHTAEGKEIWNDYLGTHSSNPKRYCIPNNARFSPDGTKIVGDSIHEPRGEIAIISSDFTSIKVLRKNEVRKK